MNPSESPHVARRIDGHVGWLTLANPARHNAMTVAMWRELEDGLIALEADPEVRIIVLRGQGERAFCAGADISQFEGLQADPSALGAFAQSAKSAMDRLRHCRKPTLAMIAGYCLGGGMGLAMCCDIRLAAEDARLGIPAVKRGLTYDYAGTRDLVSLVGLSVAKLLLFAGRQIGGGEALRIGLVDQCGPAAGLEADVAALASAIAANAPLAVAGSKLVIDMVGRDPDARDLDACAAIEAACMASADHAEATRAFMERRPPVFTGR